MSPPAPGASLECRICRDPQPPLVDACRCSTPVHPACLHRWLGYRADIQFPLLSPNARTVCEVCRQPFDAAALTADKRYDPDATWLYACAARADGVCAYIVSVQGCLLLFLFVLATMGHVLFVLGMYQGTGASTEYSIQRIALGVVNAVLTLSLLILVQKVVSRWLRESDFLFALASAPLGGGDVEMALGAGEGRARCNFVCQVLLGAFLSMLAAAEIFFLFRQLPLNGLA